MAGKRSLSDASAQKRERALAVIGWPGIRERAISATLAGAAKTQKSVAQAFANLQKLNVRSDGSGERVVAYQQKTHWSLLHMFQHHGLTMEMQRSMIEDLALQVAELKSELQRRPAGLNYRGVFREGEYQPGDAVTSGGSMWHCDKPTSERPGEGSDAWTLCVKRGRDGKNAAEAQP